MALNLKQKKAVVKEVGKTASSALSVVAAEYCGLTVSEMSELRRLGRESNVELRVVKNSLAKRALKDTDHACINEILTGPLVLAFSTDDPGGAARVMRNFSKDNKKLKVMGLSLGEDLMDASHLKVVADLPTYDQAIAILMGTMKAPAEKLVRTLVAPHTKLLRTIVAVHEQKDAA